jgi:hypothetical protein
MRREPEYIDTTRVTQVDHSKHARVPRIRRDPVVSFLDGNRKRIRRIAVACTCLGFSLGVFVTLLVVQQAR